MNLIIILALIIIVVGFIFVWNDSDSVNISILDDMKQKLLDKINGKIVDITLDRLNPLT